MPHRYLRTTRHPAASIAEPAVSCDDIYDNAASLDDVYPRIAERLAAAAHEHGEILYAVPGSPLVGERTVELLRSRLDVELAIQPALSYLDLAWSALGVDPLAAGVRLVDGHRFAIEAAGERGPLLVAQCDSRAVLSDIKLAVDEPPADAVIVLQRLGLSDAACFPVAWAELDRSFSPDHLTTLWIPTLTAPVGRELVRFHELVRTLRERCPWDREQTHRSLTKHLLEETYEVLEAIEAYDPETGTGDSHLCEELGDLLFQVEFHAVIAGQEGRFTMADVARGIHDKLVHRHPHVFGNVAAETADQVLANWEEIKAAEKGRTSLMEGIGGNLPSLLYAAKVQKKAASVGFDWDDVRGALPKIAEELRELEAVLDDARAARDELGDLLFAVVNVARHLGVDPEAALRAATGKFRARFDAVEELAKTRAIDLSTAGLPSLDALWNEVKDSEARS
ncbi:MAG: tetrapyrrole methylase family protein / MazG family protein [Acidimicrobiaceae bacterium]|nr:tetrapyrrole methylase family protein / MazG family protein [Acidimicrobiaceae bacterium]